MTRARVALLLSVLSFVLPACGVRGLNFQEDDRVTITAPGDRAEVRLPVTLSWTARDFDVVGRDGSRRSDAGYFGVYIDRAPQPPEHTQEWLAREDASCVRPCPDEEYLAQRGVFRTTDTSFVIDRVTAPSSQAPKRREFHEATIVLLNGRGERIGESAFVRQFEVDR